jgi:NAD(P)-dependent dehydrogenase (short-subunit alcohol dehydrogenase family)
MSVKNKTAIITGAANGIGKATALEMARQGFKLILVDIDKKNLDKVSSQIKNIGSEFISFKANVMKEKDVKRVLKKAKKKFKNIDILINNAGSLLLKTIGDVEDKEWEKILKTNLKGTYLFVKNISGQMKERKKGKIINIASTAGIVGLKNSSAHSAANGGIISLTRQLAVELSPYKINVNSVSPGVISTPLTKEILNDVKEKKEILLNIPLNRIGTPEEVADAILFLVEEDSNFITGHNLVVDGGWLIH